MMTNITSAPNALTEKGYDLLESRLRMEAVLHLHVSSNLKYPLQGEPSPKVLFISMLSGRQPGRPATTPARLRTHRTSRNARASAAPSGPLGKHGSLEMGNLYDPYVTLPQGILRNFHMPQSQLRPLKVCVEGASSTAPNLKHLSLENAGLVQSPHFLGIVVFWRSILESPPISGNHHAILQLGRHFERMGPPSGQLSSTVRASKV